MNRLLHCPLCQADFASSEMSCHTGCLISQHCRVLCCPHCGYQFVDTTAMEHRLDRIRRWFGRRRPQEESRSA